MILYRSITLLLFIFSLFQIGIGLKQCYLVYTQGLPYYTICGTLGNPAPYSFIIALFFPIALNYIINRKYAPRKIHNILLIFIPYIILSIIILIMSMSRTAWLACMLSIIPILTTQLKKSTQIWGEKQNVHERNVQNTIGKYCGCVS